eukprot:GHVS01006064.1.p1 GENE.GHVS01006064.1~~GHVS01006064.1.p1  ORF type:complete len:1015 (+),score=220.37 GHVS01006064.1:324-3368(+)
MLCVLLGAAVVVVQQQTQQQQKQQQQQNKQRCSFELLSLMEDVSVHLGLSLDYARNPTAYFEDKPTYTQQANALTPRLNFLMYRELVEAPLAHTPTAALWLPLIVKHTKGGYWQAILYSYVRTIGGAGNVEQSTTTPTTAAAGSESLMKLSVVGDSAADKKPVNRTDDVGVLLVEGIVITLVWRPNFGQDYGPTCQPTLVSKSDKVILTHNSRGGAAGVGHIITPTTQTYHNIPHNTTDSTTTDTQQQHTTTADNTTTRSTTTGCSVVVGGDGVMCVEFVRQTNESPRLSSIDILCPDGLVIPNPPSLNSLLSSIQHLTASNHHNQKEQNDNNNTNSICLLCQPTERGLLATDTFKCHLVCKLTDQSVGVFDIGDFILYNTFALLISYYYNSQQLRPSAQLLLPTSEQLLFKPIVNLLGLQNSSHSNDEACGLSAMETRWYRGEQLYEVLRSALRVKRGRLCLSAAKVVDSGHNTGSCCWRYAVAAVSMDGLSVCLWDLSHILLLHGSSDSQQQTARATSGGRLRLGCEVTDICAATGGGHSAPTFMSVGLDCALRVWMCPGGCVRMIRLDGPDMGVGGCAPLWSVKNCFTQPELVVVGRVNGTLYVHNINRAIHKTSQTIPTTSTTTAAEGTSQEQPKSERKSIDLRTPCFIVKPSFIQETLWEYMRGICLPEQLHWEPAITSTDQINNNRLVVLSGSGLVGEGISMHYIVPRSSNNNNSQSTNMRFLFSSSASSSSGALLSLIYRPVIQHLPPQHQPMPIKGPLDVTGIQAAVVEVQKEVAASHPAAIKALLDKRDKSKLVSAPTCRHGGLCVGGSLYPDSNHWLTTGAVLDMSTDILRAERRTMADGFWDSSLRHMHILEQVARRKTNDLTTATLDSAEVGSSRYMCFDVASHQHGLVGLQPNPLESLNYLSISPDNIIRVWSPSQSCTAHCDDELLLTAGEWGHETRERERVVKSRVDERITTTAGRGRRGGELPAAVFVHDIKYGQVALASAKLKKAQQDMLACQKNYQ